MKANSESSLCLQLGAEASGVKGVEKCPHSLLTAVEPELMGVRALRSVLMVQRLICSRSSPLRLQPAMPHPGRPWSPRLFKQKGAICDNIHRTCGKEMQFDGMLPNLSIKRRKYVLPGLKAEIRSTG